MAFCSKCGAPVDPTAQFCPSCGAPVSTTPETLPPPSPSPSQSFSPGRQRPLGVTILAILAGLGGLAELGFGLILAITGIGIILILIGLIELSGIRVLDWSFVGMVAGNHRRRPRHNLNNQFQCLRVDNWNNNAVLPDTTQRQSLVSQALRSWLKPILAFLPQS